MRYLKFASAVLLVLLVSACVLTSMPLVLSAANGQQPELRPIANANLDLTDLRQTYVFLGFTKGQALKFFTTASLLRA